jgi:hypothetical protein
MDMRIMGMGSSASSPAPVAAPRRSHQGVGKLQDHVPSPHPAREATKLSHGRLARPFRPLNQLQAVR